MSEMNPTPSVRLEGNRFSSLCFFGFFWKKWSLVLPPTFVPYNQTAGFAPIEFERNEPAWDAKGSDKITFFFFLMIPKKTSKKRFLLSTFFLMNARQTLGWVEGGEGVMCLALKMSIHFDFDLDWEALTLKPNLFLPQIWKQTNFFQQNKRLCWRPNYVRIENKIFQQPITKLRQFDSFFSFYLSFFLGIFYRYRQQIFLDFLADGAFLLPVHWKAIKNDSWRMLTNVDLIFFFIFSFLSFSFAGELIVEIFFLAEKCWQLWLRCSAIIELKSYL